MYRVPVHHSSLVESTLHLWLSMSWRERGSWETCQHLNIWWKNKGKPSRVCPPHSPLWDPKLKLGLFGVLGRENNVFTGFRDPHAVLLETRWGLFSSHYLVSHPNGNYFLFAPALTSSVAWRYLGKIPGNKYSIKADSWLAADFKMRNNLELKRFPCSLEMLLPHFEGDR